MNSQRHPLHPAVINGEQPAYKMTKREEMATKFLAAMLAHPDGLPNAESALGYADELLCTLEETK